VLLYWKAWLSPSYSITYFGGNMLSEDISKCRERIVKAPDISGKVTAFVALEPTVAKTIFGGLPPRDRTDISETLRYVLEYSTLPVEINKTLEDQDGIREQIRDRIQFFFRKGVFH
jgi:hypothetical protein